MAQLEQLMIRGIRSVGTEENDAQVIRFLNPLTIISGPNGTGKTTIIEALNYATSGAMPKGGYSTFIHSLQVARKPRVDGLVKLQFLDSKRRQCVATKRMNAAVAKTKTTKPKCASDEFNIQITAKDGSVKSLSSKVCDFQKEMLNLLAVPSAILDNVIFCHQEDSCWPLSEPKELKTRFDKIFQLTKFVKALEQMKKSKKEYESEVKVLTERQMRAEMNVKSKAKYVRDKEMTERIRSESKEKLASLKEEIEKHSQTIRDGQEKLIQMENQHREIETKQIQLTNLQARLGDLKVLPYVGTEQELRREIEEISSSSEFVDASRKKAKIEAAMRDLTAEIENLNIEKRKLETDKVQIMSAEMHRKDLQRELAALERQLAMEHDLSTDFEMEEQLTTVVEDHKRKFEALKTESDAERVACGRQLEVAQSELTRLQCEQAAAAKQVQQLDRDISAVEQRLRGAAGSQRELSDLTDRISSVESRLSALPAVDERKAAEVREHRQTAQRKVDELRRQCQDAEIFEETERESARKTQEKRENEQNLAELKEKHRAAFVAVYGSMPEGPWGDNVATNSRRTERALSQAEIAATTAERAADRETQTVRQLTEEETKLTQEAEQLRDKIWDTCGCSPVQVATRLAEVRAQLTAARKELAPLDSKAVLYESWSTEVKEKSCCPLCERKFSSKAGVTDLSNKLLNMSLSFPEETDRLKRIVLQCEEKERDLASAVVYSEQLEKLELDDLRDVRQRKSVAEQNLRENERISQEKKSALLVVKELRQKISQIQSDVSLMDTLLSTVTRLSGELRALSIQMPPAGSTPYSELKEMLTREEAEVHRLVTESDELQLASNEKNKLTEQLHALRERRITLGETAAQATHLHEQVTAKKEERCEQERQQDQIASEIPYAKRQVDRARANRDDVERRLKTKEEQLANRIREIIASQNKLNDLSAKLSALGDNEKQVERCDLAVRDAEDQIRQRESKKGRMEMQLNDLEGSQVKRRTLEDQLTRFLLEDQMRELQRQLAEYGEVEDERDALRKRIQRANILRERAENEVSRLGGQMDEIEKKYHDAVSALKQRDLINAERIYRDVIVDRLVMEQTMNDLVKYTDCLDESILQFHSEKMSAINEILDDLWRKVYKGGDIESIKIRSDMAATTEKRKAYDYRVVMIIEGGVELDMRERCSAGQKMLACILIRIALADVFGGLCSIIALDEPTTNLDQLKIEYLAEMLNDLIATRRNDDVENCRQFQMIVITHDHSLVDKLTLGSRPDYFYVLEKDDRGLAHIKRKYPDGHLELTQE